MHRKIPAFNKRGFFSALKSGLFEIRDEKDYPVLYSAIMEDVDIFITGDKDFSGLGLDRPEILTPTVFMENY